MLKRGSVTPIWLHFRLVRQHGHIFRKDELAGAALALGSIWIVNQSGILEPSRKRIARYVNSGWVSITRLSAILWFACLGTFNLRKNS